VSESVQRPILSVAQIQYKVWFKPTRRGRPTYAIMTKSDAEMYAKKARVLKIEPHIETEEDGNGI
jgi:hypothetical protein